MRSLTILLIVLLLVCGCVQEQDREISSTSSSSLGANTETTTTTSSTTTPSSTTTTLPQICFPEEDNPFTCRSTGGDPYCGDGWCKCVCPRGDNETPRLDIECDKYCKRVGYISGSCEVNMFECQVRRMVKPHYVDVLCIDARKNVCCCETNKTVEKYSQLLNNAGKGGSGITFQEQ